MCARLLACPLCSQPGFLTLDALRTGLVSVATQPLACPICNEFFLGIDKLTIHLFGHTINSNSNNVTQNLNQSNVQIVHNIQTIPVQTWNILKTQNVQIPEAQEESLFGRSGQESYVIKENEIHINPQISPENHESKQGQVIFLQNVPTDEIYSANLMQSDNDIRNSIRLDLSPRFSNIQETLAQNSQEKQITNLDTSTIENNSLNQDNVNLIQNNSNLMHNNSNLIHDNSDLIQNSLTLSLSNSNIIQTSLNLLENSSSLDQNNSNLMQSTLNLLENSSNLDQSNSNLIQTSLNLLENSSSLDQNNVNLMQSSSDLRENNSNLEQGNSNLIQTSLNLFENNSSLNENEASVMQTDSNLIQSSSNVSPNNSDLFQADSRASQNLKLIENNSGTIHTNSNVIQNNSSLNHQNEEAQNIKETIENSWIQNNSSVIIVEESARNLTDIQISNFPVKEKDENSSELSTLNENELVNQKMSEEGSKDPQAEKGAIEKLQKDILPYLKTFRLLASKEKLERCNICGYRCDDRKILILHKQLVHMISEKDVNVKPEDLLKNYPCHLCTKVFKMRGSLMVHMRVAHTNYNLDSLASDSELSPSNENGFKCPVCGKYFKKEQHVIQHLKTHDGKQWECDVCSKMFTTKYFLKKHKRLHSGEMPYKCNICDKTFTFQQSYHKHRLYHKDDKPHSCNTCGRSFKELSTLHNHERIHTGEKPFACETCGKCFRQRVSYLVHRRIHTGVMPYKCASCGKSFRYKVSQRTHKCQTPSAAESSTQNSEILLQKLLQISEAKEKKEEQVQLANVKCKERNKFILLMGEDGEPILTRESDLEKGDEKKEDSNVESAVQENTEKGEESMWIQESNNIDFKESMAVSANEQNSNEKLHLEVPPDLFSMMLPLEKDLPTPSAEMEHLRLSSPTQKENGDEIMENFSENLNKLDMMEINTRNSEERFQDNINHSLGTIDDASLNELIYGIVRE